MEEIEEVVGDKTTVEADDLDKLTYMNQVSKCGINTNMNQLTQRVFSTGVSRGT